ncbi:hypothetical protein ACFWWB_01395 [Streptomyces sp. NPDC058690]|uniref:hypothetical protein n=1 Tax=Streptomyces sp. NPDC058690 TaxID=3346600 RepID=UPI003647666A
MTRTALVTGASSVALLRTLRLSEHAAPASRLTLDRRADDRRADDRRADDHCFDLPALHPAARQQGTRTGAASPRHGSAPMAPHRPARHR